MHAGNYVCEAVNYGGRIQSTNMTLLVGGKRFICCFFFLHAFLYVVSVRSWCSGSSD